MKKVKVSLKINDYKINTYGYINNNILSFKDNDKDNTKIIFDFNNNKIIRDNEEINLVIDLNNKINTYKLKKENINFDQNIEINLLQNENNKYIINYQIEDNTFDLYLNYEEEEK